LAGSILLAQAVLTGLATLVRASMARLPGRGDMVSVGPAVVAEREELRGPEVRLPSPVESGDARLVLELLCRRQQVV